MIVPAGVAGTAVRTGPVTATAMPAWPSAAKPPRLRMTVQQIVATVLPVGDRGQGFGQQARDDLADHGHGQEGDKFGGEPRDVRPGVGEARTEIDGECDRSG